RKYKKNLQQLFILHGGMTMKLFFEFARMFISEKFYRKLQFLNNVEELYGVIPPTNLELPDEVMEYEQSLHAQPEQSGVRATQLVHEHYIERFVDAMFSCFLGGSLFDAIHAASANFHFPQKQGQS